MTPQPFPADLDEFFRRLEVRRTETDLRVALRDRLERERRLVRRAGRADTVIAFASRVVPSRSVPPEALAAFLDETFDQQKGRGDEPFGMMPRARMIPAGFQALDEVALGEFGRAFAELASDLQDDLIVRAERAELPGPDGFDSGYWFERARELLLLGYGSDPRGMVEMGFPGPSYLTGHVWLSRWEIESRVQRKPGYLRL
jgi:Gluconate 2-dehydrogenase subunit 3